MADKRARRESNLSWGHWLASADTYGADRKWVLLKPIPIELDPDEEMGAAGEGGPSGQAHERMHERTRELNCAVIRNPHSTTAVRCPSLSPFTHTTCAM